MEDPLERGAAQLPMLGPIGLGQKTCWRPKPGSRFGSWFSSCAMLAFSAPTFLGL